MTLNELENLVKQSRLYRDLQTYEGALDMVFNTSTSAFAAWCSGSPGIGKSFLAERVVARWPMMKLREINPEAKTFPGLVACHSAATDVLAVIDSDHIWGSERMTNYMKHCLEQRRWRHLADDRHQGSRRVEFATRFIFQSNKDITDLTQFEAAMRPHIAAISSRLGMLKIILSFDLVECYRYSVWLATCGGFHRRGFLRDECLPLAASNEVLAWFASNCWRLDEVSPRRLRGIARVRRDSPIWQALLEQHLPADIPPHRQHLPQMESVVIEPRRQLVASIVPPPAESAPHGTYTAELPRVPDPGSPSPKEARKARIMERIKERAADDGADAWLRDQFMPAVRDIIATHSERSPSALANRLNERGFGTSSGRGKWWAASVTDCLERARRAGVSLDD